MNIEYNHNHIACDFVDLYFGDVFEFYKDGEKYICMKINNNSKDNIYVDLATGEVHNIELHTEVYEINAKIIIE